VTNLDEHNKNTHEELSALVDGESQKGWEPLLTNDPEMNNHVKMWARFHLISDALHKRDPDVTLGQDVSTRVSTAIEKEPVHNQHSLWDRLIACFKTLSR
jgi:negative regulator of sigma E activity